MATSSEKLHLDAVQALGCIVCRLQQVYSPAEIHHILDGGRRKGHRFVIPLCVPHHRAGSGGAGGFISRHPYKARFESEYGTESELLARVEDMLHERT